MAEGEHNLRKRRRSSTESRHSENVTPTHKTHRRRSRPMPFWMQFIITILAGSAAFFAILAFYPSGQYECKTYTLPPRPALKGPTAVNDILKKSEYILEDEILGPESLLIENGTIYTGTQDGLILEIYGGEIRRDARFTDEPCGAYELEPKCGRPLGIRRLNNEELVVMDSYLGIYTINFDAGSFKRIFDPKVKADGLPVKFFNDVDVVNEDLIVFTHSSTKWQRRDFFRIIMEGIPNGRVLSFVPSTGEIKVLMKDLYFPNGIQLFPDKQSFLVAETTMARIKRYWIAGPKKGTTEIFADNLPGLPDNIRLSSSGNSFWVGIATVRRHQQFSMVDFLADKSSIRKFLLKLIPGNYWHMLHSKLKSLHAMIIELDTNGQIISSAHDVNGVLLTEVSQVSDDGEYLYMGSYEANFIAKLHKSYLHSP